jgi:hypothetical protein
MAEEGKSNNIFYRPMNKSVVAVLKDRAGAHGKYKRTDQMLKYERGSPFATDDNIGKAVTEEHLLSDKGPMAWMGKEQRQDWSDKNGRVTGAQKGQVNIYAAPDAPSHLTSETAQAHAARDNSEYPYRQKTFTKKTLAAPILQNGSLLLSTNIKKVDPVTGRQGDYFYNKFKPKIGYEFTDIELSPDLMVGSSTEFENSSRTGQFGRAITDAQLGQMSFRASGVLTYPGITKARFKINGEFGSLRKAEIEMTCGSLEQLNEIDRVLFQKGLGRKVLVRFGEEFQTPVNFASKPGEEYVIYDWSWNLIHPRLIEITFKMVGASNLCTAVDTNNQIDGITNKKEFVYDWRYNNNTRPVQSIIDCLDYDMQQALGYVEEDSSILDWTFVGALDGKHRAGFTFPVEAGSKVKQFDNNSTMHDTFDRTLEPLVMSNNISGVAVVYRMDNIPEFNETNGLNGNSDGDSAEVYYSLGYIVHRLINYWLLELGAGGKIADDIKKVKYCVRALAKTKGRKYLMSTDPLNILITNSEKFSYQCTYGEYYTSNGKDGDPESADGDDDADDWTDNWDGKDFSPGTCDPAGGTFSDISSGGVLSPANICTYTDLPVYANDNEMMIENILISRNYLRTLDPNKKLFDQRYKSTTSDDKIDVAEFLNAIFKKIKQVTAGYIDLMMVEVDKRELFNRPTGEHDQIWIVNRNQVIDKGPVTPGHTFNLKIKDGNVIGQKLSMKVPKAMAAEAFGRQSPGKVGGTNTKSLPDPSTKDEDQEEKTKIETLMAARNKLFESGFDNDSSSAALAALKDFYTNTETPQQKIATESVPYPLDLSITIQGTYGFKFGDYLGINFLPDRYDSSKGGLNVAFTVIEVTHEFERMGNWVTQLKTMARIKGIGKGNSIDASIDDKAEVEQDKKTNKKQQAKAKK